MSQQLKQYPCKRNLKFKLKFETGVGGEAVIICLWVVNHILRSLFASQFVNSKKTTQGLRAEAKTIFMFSSYFGELWVV